MIDYLTKHLTFPAKSWLRLCNRNGFPSSATSDVHAVAKKFLPMEKKLANWNNIQYITCDTYSGKTDIISQS